MGFLRVVALLFLVLLAVHVALRVILGQRERARLGREWERVGAGVPREAFVADGMERYRRSLKPKLLWGVIVLPMAGFALLLYLLNVS